MTGAVADLDNAALLVIDMQRDFIDGSWVVPGAREIIPTVNLWIEIFEDLEQPIVYSLDWHPEVTKHFDGGRVHCVAGTPGAQIHRDVIYDPVEMAHVYTVQKGLELEDGFSVCSSPAEVFGFKKRRRGPRMESYVSVAHLLETLGTKRVVVVGLATDYCVRASVVDLLELGYEVIVVTEAIAGLESATTFMALQRMAEMGATFVDKDGKPLTEVALPVAV